MRTFSAVLLAAAALAAAAPTASAAITSNYSGGPAGTLTVTSDEAADTITVTCPGATLLINGAAPPMGPPTCSGTLLVFGNGGADTIDVSTLTDAATNIGTLTLDGGEGDDDLRGVSFGSNGYVVTLEGGAGADRLTLNGSDQARGGAGDDRLIGLPQGGNPGVIGLDGGDGGDTFAWDLSAASPVSFAFTVADTGLTVSAAGVPDSQSMPFGSIEAVDMELNEGGQTFDGSAFSGTARVDGNGGADTIKGTAGPDNLIGGEGNDFIDGGGGADVYQGGSGLDLLHARDGVADAGDCGADEDTLVADAVDAIVGCERVDLPVIPPPPPVPDTTKPALGVKRAALRGRRLRLPVSCPASESRCAGIVKLAAVARRRGRSVSVALGTITFTLAGGDSKTLTRRLSKRQRRALVGLRRPKLRVKLDVFDAVGNRTTKTQRVALRL